MQRWADRTGRQSTRTNVSCDAQVLRVEIRINVIIQDDIRVPLIFNSTLDEMFKQGCLSGSQKTNDCYDRFHSVV